MIKILLIIFLSIPIFQFRIYWLLVDSISVGWAYVIDQLLPLVVTCIFAFLIVKKNVQFIKIKQWLKTNALPLLAITVTILVVHGWILGNYFMGEEPNTILTNVNNRNKEVLVYGILRGYHYGIYVLSYELFHTHAMLYNVVALTLYVLTAAILYIFLNLLFNKKIIPAFIGTLFFVTTPSYMDMFFWQSNFSGMPIALSVGMLSLIFLLAYQKNNKMSFYLLSLLFFLSMIKIGFNRMHAFIVLPLFMCLFPIISGKFNKLGIKKIFFTALPFICIFLSFILMIFIFPDQVFEKGISIRGAPLNVEGYTTVFLMFIAYLFIPSQFAETYYPKIKHFLIGSSEVSITILFGALGFALLVVVGLIALRHIRKEWGRLLIFALVTIFSNLILTPLFIQGYNNSPAGIDQRFSNTGVSNGPGIRYVFVSAMGFSLLVAVLTYWVVINKRKYRNILLITIFVLFVYYSYLSITSYKSALESINPGKSAVPNSVFSMVPKDGKKKLLYSVNPQYNAIDSKIGDWIHAFYKLDELKYSNSFTDVSGLIDSGSYERSNFYAFYNNPLTQSFKDVSELARVEFYDGAIPVAIQPIQDSTLMTSFTDSDNLSFPRVLSRGIYILKDINLRVLSPHKFTISIQKQMIFNEFPYVDAFIVKEDKIWRGAPFPMEIWDMLKNKPLIVDIGQLNVPLSVPSLGNQTIDKYPLDFRLKAARELIKRENSKEPNEIIMSDVEKINKHYIDTPEILSTYLESPSFNSLVFVYACAEDSDWDNQNSSQLIVSGIWYMKEFRLGNSTNEKLEDSLTCFGSVLRRIVLVGPPVPGKINVNLEFQ